MSAAQPIDQLREDVRELAAILESARAQLEPALCWDCNTALRSQINVALGRYAAGLPGRVPGDRRHFCT